jgi:putative tricarboxylic transport membrane protein
VWEQFRGVIAPGGLTPEQKAYWTKALLDVTKSAEWSKYLEENTLRPLVKSGADVDKYIETLNATTKTVLTKLGLVK